MTTAIDVKIDEKITVKRKEPSLYKVVFLNDDVTPIDFVMGLLIELFKHTSETALDITMKIHTEGSGVVGVYSFEIAEQKSIEAINLSRENGFPLKVRVEEDK